ncbi:hypothetical protein AcV5_002324 [Taiwanofungus camphoratus]|nr:hypothetical protein AcV5_002324 [Antrodia cinnamomea]
MCDVRGHARIGDTGRAIAPQWTDLAGGSDDIGAWGRKRGGMRDGTVGDERASACPIGEKRLGSRASTTRPRRTEMTVLERPSGTPASGPAGRWCVIESSLADRSGRDGRGRH